MRTVYRNAQIHSPRMPDRAATAPPTAFVVDRDTIAWVGADDAVGTDETASSVDLGGALVTPVFVDAHVHLTATGLALTGLDLGRAGSLAAALDLVAGAARTVRGRPVLGSGWDETGWPEARPPSATDLDRAAYGGLVYLARVDAHSAVVSSALMAVVPGLAGMNGFRRDGLMTCDAHDAVRTAALRGLSAGQIRDAQRAALRHAASLGIGCVHEMAGPAISSAADLASALALAAAEALPEVVGYWGELHGVATARELGAHGAAGDLFCDGSLGSHTAALHEPYSDAPDVRGALRFDTAELVQHIELCEAAGLQAGFHAIGDAAVDQVLDAFETASLRLGRRVGAGHRIEHAEYVRDPARLAAVGLTASMQPMFDRTWGGPDGMYARRLGAERAAALNRFAELAATGVPLAFGSDAPVTPLGPWAAVQAAVQPTGPVNALAAHAAFTAHTVGGHRAAGGVGDTHIAAGAPATFAVWAAGPLQNGLPDLAVGAALPVCLQTTVRGRAIHQLDT